MRTFVVLKNWFFVFIWMLIIFTFSSIPSLKIEILGVLDLILRKGCHLLEFGILNLLFLNAFSKTFSWGKNRYLFWSSFLSIIYAVLDEYHQSFVPGRYPNIFDVFVDSCGVMVSNLSWIRRIVITKLL